MKGFSKVLIGGMVLACFAGPVAAAPLGTGFTYQGQLNSGGSPVTGVGNFRFSLWDSQAGGAQLGSSQIVANVPLSAGAFTVELNAAGQFGATAFDGSARYLQIEVCVDNVCSGVPTMLTPRQPLTGSPYALDAKQTQYLRKLDGGIGLQINAGSATNTPGLYAGTQDAHDLVMGSFLDGGYAHGFISTGYTNYTRKVSIGRSSTLDRATAVFEPQLTVVSNSGNVGIGNALPDYPLSFSGSPGDKIALTTGAGHYGLGIGSNLLQIHTASGVGSIGFGYGSSSSFTEHARIDGNGRLGIGTTLPQEKLDVRGNIRLGSTGQEFAASGEENLRIIRGAVNGCGTGTIQYGGGFTLTPGCQTNFIRTITFDTPFSSPPVVVATSTDCTGCNTSFCEIVLVTTTQMKVAQYMRSDGSYIGGPFNFVAIGPR